MNYTSAMLNPYRPQDDNRRASTSADSISSSSIATIKPPGSDKDSSTRRFVSAPIRASSRPQDVAGSIERGSISYTRDGSISQQSFGHDDYLQRRSSISSGSMNGSPRLHRTESSISKRFSLRSPSFGFGARSESPSQHSVSSQQDDSSPSRQNSLLGRMSSRRVATMGGADTFTSPKRPPLVTNVSSPSILGLSSRTIDTYRRESPETTANMKQPAPRLYLNTRQDSVPKMADLQFRTHQARSPDSQRSNPVTPEAKEGAQVKRTKSNASKEEKKSMLSRALKRANDAVALDNTQDYAGAMKAYEEACDCLREVMKHSSNNDDRSKLESIRGTYVSRIQELQQADGVWSHAQPLQQLDNPTRPLVIRRARSPIPPVLQTRNLDKSLPALPRTSRIQVEESLPLSTGERPVSVNTTWSDEDYDISIIPPQAADRFSFGSDLTEQDSDIDNDYLMNARIQQNTRNTSRNQDPLRPAGAENQTSTMNLHHVPLTSDVQQQRQEQQNESRRSIANPDMPSYDLQLNPTLTRDSDTEAAFNAALDAAVEAVYDDGYEPIDNSDLQAEDKFSSTRRLTAERNDGREAAIAAAIAHERERISSVSSRAVAEDYLSLGLGDDMEEDERLLEEITRDFMLDNSALDEEAKSALPRQSDSSTSSSAHTWDSSAGSSVHTAGTSLSPVREKPTMAYDVAALPYGLSSKSFMTSAPLLSSSSMAASTQTPLTLSTGEGLTVQGRRLSRSKHLQIRTVVDARPPSSASQREVKLPVASQPESDASATEMQTSVRNKSIVAITIDPTEKSAITIDSPSLIIPAAALAPARSASSGILTPLSSPTAVTIKTGFALPFLNQKDSIRSSKERKPGEKVDTPADTPSSFGFSAGSISSARFLPQPFSSVAHSSVPLSTNQLDFLIDIHDPTGKQHRQSSIEFPSPLEHCPEASLLRPFWLLRCVYQTIAHPRGGYLSTKLFISRNVWRVQSVKLKAIEEKTAACDQLTNALARLRKAGTANTDALQQEMQHLESVIDQVQAILNKKLGNDVGPKDLSSSFRDAPPSTSFNNSSSSFAENPLSTSMTASSSTTLRSTSGSSGGKSYLSSLGRKLRNKPSHNSLAASFASTSGSLISTTNAAAYTLATIPMTTSASSVLPSTPTRQMNHSSRPQTSSSFLSPPLSTSLGGKPLTDGPYVLYASALARLCDTAQVMVQIVQLTENTSEKRGGAAPTQQLAALEAGTRRVSEFFGLWVGRWVLADVGLLADKWVKRGGESLVA